MGFFLEDKDVAALESRPKRREPKTAHGTLPVERGCDECPLQAEWPRLSTPRMKLSGRKEADILVLGEGPGEDEDLEGKPFVGKSGKFLRRYLPFRDMERLAWTNTVRCRPPGNRTPTGLEAHCCSIFMEEDIERNKFKAVLGLGSTPLLRFMNEVPITQMAGIKFPVRIGNQTLWYFPVFHPSFVMRSGEEDAEEFPIFRSDLKRFFKEVDSWKKPRIREAKPENVNLVYHEDVARSLLARMKPVPLGFDVETSSLRPYEFGARCLTAAFSDGETTFAFPIDHPEAKTEWGMRFMLEVCQTHPWVAHSASMELRWLLYHGRRLYGSYEPAPFDDSMCAARVYFEREHIRAMAAVSRIVLGVNIKKLTDVDAANILAYPLEDVLPYNGLDAWGCEEICTELIPKTHKGVYTHLLGAMRSTAEMELAGLPVDLDYADELKKNWGGKAEKLQAEARNIYEVRMFEREIQREFSLSAPADVGTALVMYGKLDLPKTAKGKQYATKDEILQPYATSNPLVQLVLDYREATKHESTYIDAILEVPEKFPDGNIHPMYNVVNVATLRHCVAGDTILKTSRGSFRIDEYTPFPGDTILTHKNRQRRITKKFQKGRAFMWKIVINSDTQITATEGHVVLTPDGWKYIRDLRVGDFVYACGKAPLSESARNRRNVSNPLGYSNAGHSQRIRRQHDPSLRAYPARNDKGRTKTNKIAAICFEQNGRQKSHARQNARIASSLDRGMSGSERLYDDPMAGSTYVCASRRNLRILRMGKTSPQSNRPSHRRGRAEQRHKQPSSHDKWGSQEIARIRAIIAIGEREVWDIEVEEDHSYIAQGLIHHNSSNQVNIQNFPKRRHRELRKMIRARPGHVLLACDEGQLEARIYGMVTQDSVLCSSIINGEDIHTYWLERALYHYPEYEERLALKTNTTDEKKIREAGRDIIKTDMVFATFFGTVPKNCAERTGIPFEIMRALIDEFWQRYPEARKWLNNQMKTYRETGEVRMLTGLVRRGVFPGLEAVNTPIQATGAHLVIEAQNELSELSREIDDFYLHPRIQIHDDITFELPDDDALIEEYLSTIADSMTKVRYPWQTIPLMVKAKLGYNWADMSEIAVITGDYVR